MQEPGYGAPIPPPSGHYNAPQRGPRQGEPNGILILILGILGITTCGVFAPIAWVMGNNALTLIDSGQGDPGQRQYADIGRWPGIAGCALLVLSTLIIVGVIMVGSGARPR